MFLHLAQQKAGSPQRQGANDRRFEDPHPAEGTKYLERRRRGRIVSPYTAYADEEDKSIVVSVDKIAEKGYDLSPNKYVQYHKETVTPYAEVFAEFKAAYQNMIEAETKFRNLINRHAV